MGVSKRIACGNDEEIAGLYNPLVCMHANLANIIYAITSQDGKPTNTWGVLQMSHYDNLPI